MHAQWTQGWWLWAIRGIVAVFFGIIAVLYPAPSLLLAVLLFGAYLQLDGLATFALSTSLGLHNRAVWLLAAAGLIGLIGGMLIMVWPDAEGEFQLAMLGVCCVARGSLEAAQAVRFRAALPRARLLTMAGALSVAFGLLLLLDAKVPTSTFALAFASFVTSAGLCMITSALSMRAAEANALTTDGTNIWRG